jgi:hypothetical protein
MLANKWGDPSALPGRQQKFDKSGSGFLSRATRLVKDPCCDRQNGLLFASAPFANLEFDFNRL